MSCATARTADEFRSSPQLTTISPPEGEGRGSSFWGCAMRSRMARRRPCRRHPVTRTSVRKNRMYDRMRLSQSLPAVRPVGTRSPPQAGGGPGGASASAARGEDSHHAIGGCSKKQRAQSQQTNHWQHDEGNKWTKEGVSRLSAASDRRNIRSRYMLNKNAIVSLNVI